MPQGDRWRTKPGRVGGEVCDLTDHKYLYTSNTDIYGQTDDPEQADEWTCSTQFSPGRL